MIKSTNTAAKLDVFGNPIAASRGYAYGKVLRGPEDEVKRMLHGRLLVQARGTKYGTESVHNLTGVTREFPIAEKDLENLRTQVGFYTNFEGRGEPLGIAYSGGSVQAHDACFVTRVSAGMLATCLTLMSGGDKCLSIVPKGRSHPSVPNGARIAGAKFDEVIGVEEGLQAITDGKPQVVIVTTITPQKFNFEEAELVRLIETARASGAEVILDDAHVAVRTGYFKQRPGLQLGDVAVVLSSMDKHLRGPRAGLLTGRKDIVRRIRANVYELGVEAPFPSYVASMRAIQGYDVASIEEASKIADEVFEALLEAWNTTGLYKAGPGVACSEDVLTEIVAGLASSECLLTPTEVSSMVAMRLVENAGIMTILSIGMPGASSAFRIMAFPDAHRLGSERVIEAVLEAVAFTAQHVEDLDFVSAYICGDSK